MKSNIISKYQIQIFKTTLLTICVELAYPNIANQDRILLKSRLAVIVVQGVIDIIVLAQGAGPAQAVVRIVGIAQGMVVIERGGADQVEAFAQISGPAATESGD